MARARMRRIDEAIRQVLGDVLAGEIKDPRVGIATVTEVRTSADLSHARVFVSAIERGDGVRAPEEGELLDGLRSAHGFLQRRLAAELKLKRTPVLSFVHDGSAERAQRLYELLEEQEAAEDAAGEAQADEALGAAAQPPEGSPGR